MPSGKDGLASRWTVLLAGLQSGVLGGFAMLVWLSILSVWNGRSIWAPWNLFASTFFGESALRRGLRWSTLSGASLHLFLAGVLGILFGLGVSGIASRWRVRLLGLLVAVLWNTLWFGSLWKRLNPFMALYGPDSGLMIAHLALGYFLGSFPRYRRRLEAEPVPEVVEAAAPLELPEPADEAQPPPSPAQEAAPPE
ncbi:MAG: hypothetical protein ACRD8O_01165 [Bryobacteraceae bacterium]